MVLGEVGEDRHVKTDARHPLQGQGVGGDLHHHMGAASVQHLAKELVQLVALGGGVLRVEQLVADHVAVGADEPAWLSSTCFSRWVELVLPLVPV